jgi:uncharacterized protein (DUF2267 family)
MSNTGVVSLDHGIDNTNAWLSDVAEAFGTKDRALAYRVTRSWLHADVRDLIESKDQAQVSGGGR